MNPKPDDRRDNVQRIQENIDNTLKNISLANDMIAKSDNPDEIQNMKEKNVRREEALSKMICEIRDEALANKNNMK
ncbi:small acid-soluble spore protein Tlp [Clostridium sp. SM-530-WT-3G]|uniref:small acid-soluble spore protein Tlp n=1 Tax=Clostridium sp. SM-530-WT-3G TaxID=2725303 RepID=UPI00145CB05C|nr:small acid-soluble spore protein Tlp [Clostridium sp. SM-530-WT-3G]NME82114.1 small acid-soluble spore protein Tlp [Clostridium sp. SM-530-WT-3G]